MRLSFSWEYAFQVLGRPDLVLVIAARPRPPTFGDLMRQRLRRLLLAPVAASLALVIAPPADASSTPDPVAAGTPQGLLVNAGMEAAGRDDLPDGWEAAGTGKSRGTVVRDAAAARTGSAGV